jgi:hypothetical protein
MNEIATTAAPPATRKPDPREVLDAKKRTRICGLLALGYSRRMAAEHVGCDPSTITRTAKRDENFRQQLAAAQADADIEALKLIRRTADQEKYWRAAAWILERRNPDEYGRRPPNSFSGEQVMQILARVLQVVMPSVPSQDVEEVMSQFEEELGDVAEKARLPLPEYDPAEEEDDDLAPVDPPQIASETKAPAAGDCPNFCESPGISSRVVGSKNGTVPLAASPPATQAAAVVRQGAASVVDRPAPVGVAGLLDAGKRVSCLQQFVERGPKAAATANGRR